MKIQVMQMNIRFRAVAEPCSSTLATCVPPGFHVGTLRSASVPDWKLACHFSFNLESLVPHQFQAILAQATVAQAQL